MLADARAGVVYTRVSLDNACNVDFMHQYYTVQASAAVTRDVEDFKPYANNFRIVDIFINRSNNTPAVLVLQFALPVDVVAKGPPPASWPYATSAQPSRQEVLLVSVSFPPDYPSGPMQVYLAQMNKNNNSDAGAAAAAAGADACAAVPLWRSAYCNFVASNGRVQLDRLAIRRVPGEGQGVLLSLLLVLKSRLEELAARVATASSSSSSAATAMMPSPMLQPTGAQRTSNNNNNMMTSSAAASAAVVASSAPATVAPTTTPPPPACSRPSAQQQQQRWEQDMATALAHDMATMRDKAVQEAAERVVIDLNEKATSYLQTRRQALRHLRVLEPANEQLGQIKELLVTHKTELQRYLPSVGEVHALLAQIDGRADTLDEHERCLVAEDALQSRALELMADIHAAEDTLSLLEEGLRSEQLSCDDYVRYVSDIGRMLFVTRFLYHRVMEQMGRGGSSSGIGDQNGGMADRLAVSSGSAGGSSSSSNNNSTLVTPAAHGNGGAGEVASDDVVQTSAIAVPHHRAPPEEVLQALFPSIDRGIIVDVLANVRGDVKEARQQLHALASQ